MMSIHGVMTGIMALVTFFGAFATGTPAADTTSNIEKEILSHPETDLAVLGKARLVLLEAVKSRDSARIQGVLTFMEHRFDADKVLTLYRLEKVLIAYWISDYGKILSFAREDESNEAARRPPLLPERDLLFDQLQICAREGASYLSERIDGGDLRAHEKDFLNLFLRYLGGPSTDSSEEHARFQDGLNTESDEYLATYAGSEYAAFIRNHIRYVIRESEWGLGYELALGYLALPDDLGRHMKDFGILSFSGEAAYRRALACLRLDVGAAHHMRQGFEYHGTWKDNLLVMHYCLLLAGGPRISLGDHLVLTPHTGVAVLNFSPPSDEEKQEGNDVSLTCAALAIGMNADIPLGGESGSPYLRLNIGQRFALTGIALARGGYTYVTLGVNFFERPRVRDF